MDQRVRANYRMQGSAPAHRRPDRIPQSQLSCSLWHQRQITSSCTMQVQGSSVWCRTVPESHGGACRCMSCTAACTSWRRSS